MFNVTQSFKGTQAVKVTHAVITAAVIAGIFTAVTSPNDRLVAAAVTASVQPVAKTCDEPWPYLNCGGAQSSDQTIRVIRIN